MFMMHQWCFNFVRVGFSLFNVFAHTNVAMKLIKFIYYPVVCGSGKLGRVKERGERGVQVKFKVRI